MYVPHCPKCSGRLFQERESDVKEVYCISCGWRQEVQPEPKPLAEIDWTQIKNQWSVKH